MMMMPRMFEEDLFDNWPVFPFEREMRRSPLYGRNEKNLMKTDLRETDAGYEMDVDLPGFKKEDVSLKLENGYLTVSAEKALEEEKSDKKSGYLHQERWSGSCSRSFYVGENVATGDIKAKMENGILHMTFPKKENRLPASSQILIEG